METREKFKSIVFGLTCPEGYEFLSSVPPSFTIGRVMHALININNDYHLKAVDYRTPNLVTICKSGDSFSGRREIEIKEGYTLEEYIDLDIVWKLTKDGKECTDDDQTDETIEAIYELIK